MGIETEKLRQTLSSNIKRLRKINGITQETLAELTDLSWQTINSIEGCRIWVSDNTIVRLAKALGVEVYQLLIPQTEEITEKNSEVTIQELLGHLQKNLQQRIKKEIDNEFKSIQKVTDTL
jgi:transcriptional regulator with XRE-family HTH domain